MSNRRLPFLAQHVLNTPLAIHPQKAEIIIASLAGRFNVGGILRADQNFIPVPAAWYGAEADDTDIVADRDRPYDLESGVAIIEIEGTLAHKLGWMDAMSGLTGYIAIRSAFLDALNDPAVKAIALAIDSPGGDVSGCFDLVDLIYNARGRKPIWAILNECAYSAAYAIASAADVITIPRTGGAGSIGVVALLADISRANDMAGITINILTHGAQKADGNPYQVLPEEARARFQQRIDTLGELFIETVARNRALPASAIQDLQAGCFGAGEALALGLVDAIAAPDAAFQALLEDI